MANQYDTNLKLQAIADAIGDTQSSGLIQALEDIADAVAGGGGGGSSTAGLVSDNFSETDTYDLGDYCIHNNTLYVCINAINTPGPWDLSDWQATNAGLELSSLNSALGTADWQYNNKVLFTKTGNTVTCNINGLSIGNYGQSSQPFILDSKYFPAMSALGRGVAYKSDTNILDVTIEIGVSGSMVIKYINSNAKTRTTITDSSYSIYGTMSWITAN